jgi:hypothetical protein
LRDIFLAGLLIQTARRLTEAEYFKLERAAQFKSEFLNGELFAMAGGTLQHSLMKSSRMLVFLPPLFA